MSNLAGKIALVSGAGSPGGIGFAIAKSLSAQGASVIITSTTDRIYDRAKEIGATGYICDLTDSKATEQLVSKISALDILINNAGMSSITSPLAEDEASDLSKITVDGYKRGIARNLDTAFNLSKASLGLLRKSKAGRIIMISSTTGHLMAMRNQAVYAAAKAGLIGFTKALAVDEAINKITVNAILPGWIKTDTQNEFEYQQGLKTPLQRSGSVGEVASLATFLASDGAAYITGQAIAVDGGNSIAEERG